jgi:AcrR family transcriptional regulator
MNQEPKTPPLQIIDGDGGSRALTGARTSKRYARKKDAIVSAATGIMNRRGVRGMTLGDVAAAVDLSTTSVTYYFRRKEDLAVACFLRGIAWYDALFDSAFTQGDPQTKLKRFIELYLEKSALVREGDAPPLVMFNDIHALKEPYLSQVLEPYNALFRKARTLFLGPGSELDRNVANARTHAFMEQIYWSVVWLARYHIEDFGRIAARIFDILTNGIAVGGAAWEPVALGPDTLDDIYPAPRDASERQRETFLIAATRLINEQGYRGASVEKISAELNVTKGSFYHHNEAKDDLVIACFERTFDVIRRVQTAAMKAGGNEWQRLCSAAATLAEYQVSDRGPLLRAAALSALPESIREDMLARFTRSAERFAAMISDGISEGSVRPVDPVIAAQLLNAALNASASLKMAVPGGDPREAARLYARPLLMGMFAP